jgi:hypothetical protein
VLAHTEFVICDQSIERTFSWLGQNRRMSKDYERPCATGEAFIYAEMVCLIVRRLAVSLRKKETEGGRPRGQGER